MKKILCFLLVLSVLASLCGAACADLTVRRVNPPEEKEEADLSDLKLNREAEIEDFGLLTLTDFQFRDKFYLWEKGMKDTSVNRSGTEADYAVLYADIVNTAPKARTFAAECTVSVMFDGEYEYEGWFFQSEKSGGDGYGMDESDRYDIDPLYAGHFIFGCTLPNYVVQSEKPLAMTVSIDGVEFTCNIRK